MEQTNAQRINFYQEAANEIAEEKEKKLILIVDDIPLNRAILCELFKERYQVLEAKNGKAALTLLEDWGDTIAVVLLDVVMPIMDGMEFLKEFSARGWLGQIPVVLITAENSESTAMMGYEMGVVDIIDKPFNPNIVKRRVENIIELYIHKFRLEQMLKKQMLVLERQSEKIKQINHSVIDTLSTLVEFRNCESGLHIKRIRKITKLLLEALAGAYQEYMLSPETIETISSAAAMHDIGKIAIPDSVLNKKGKLTLEEFEVMKTHTIRGCEILESLDYAKNEDFYSFCYEICCYHHERWDGKGYPNGCKGEEIPIWAQVVSLADVYEALTSERVYKPPYSHGDAIKMINRGECGAFNPLLLNCFLKIAGSLEEKIEQAEQLELEEFFGAQVSKEPTWGKLK